MSLAVTFEWNKPEPKELTIVKLLAENKTKILHVKSASTSDEYAVKIFTQNETSLTRFQREKKIITCLHHPNIIKYYPISSHNADSDILITEYARYGDFFGAVKGKYLTQDIHLRTYFHQLIDGLEYMHSQHIAHLDIKLENLLIGSDFVLKIADFDQSHSQEEKLVCSGTNSYRPLEILEKRCENIFAADIYSAGVVLYALKTKQFPFVEFKEEGQTRIMSVDLFLENNDKFWKVKTKKLRKNDNFFSKDFKNLLNGMLQKDPAKRFTISDIKASRWYNMPILSLESLKAHMMKSIFGVNKKNEDNKKGNKKFSKTLCSFISPLPKCVNPTRGQGNTNTSDTNSPSSVSATSSKKSKFSILGCLFSRKRTAANPTKNLSPDSEKASSFTSIPAESGYHYRPWNLDLRPVAELSLKPVNEDDISKISLDLNFQQVPNPDAGKTEMSSSQI